MHVFANDELRQTRQQLLLEQEQQRTTINEVIAARDKVRVVDPDCRLLLLVDAKLARLGVEASSTSAWAA